MNSQTTIETRTTGGNQGFALISVMLVVMAVAVLATGATLVGSSNVLGNRYYDQQAMLNAQAEIGLERVRAFLNADPDAYPDDGFITIEDGEPVTGPDGEPMDGVRRWTYAGPTGSIYGQYGVFGSIVSVVRSDDGGVAIRRSQVFQESFAKYAYFTDFEPSNIRFGGGDQIFGPVHTNSDIRIYSSGATFHDEVRMAGNVVGASYGTFKKGYEEKVSPIPMPETADLARLEAQAITGGTRFDGPTASFGEATLRIEFVALDLNGDGDTADENEGFLKAYYNPNATFTSGDVPGGGIDDSETCGVWYGSNFVVYDDHPKSGTGNVYSVLNHPNRRCYLGGADELWGQFMANDPEGGEWLEWSGTPSPLLAGRPDAQYLFPLSRSMNPNFKGVVYVEGSVMVSGTLRGRVTLAASEDIIIGDDIQYVTDPSIGTCVDIFGMFAGDDVIVADNALNSPVRLNSGWPYFTYDDTKDEYIQGIVLALSNFTVENFSSGSTSAEWCENVRWGRGCLYLTGGIIQEQRGAVGTTAGTGGLKRYAYDKCGATSPPPYYPTTGHFARGQQFIVDPDGFNVGQFFDFLTSS